MESRTLDVLFADAATFTCGSFPRVPLSFVSEPETGMHRVQAVTRDSLGDIECALLHLCDGNYLVHKSDPKSFGCVDHFSCDRQRERTSLAHGR